MAISKHMRPLVKSNVEIRPEEAAVADDFGCTEFRDSGSTRASSVSSKSLERSVAMTVKTEIGS